MFVNLYGPTEITCNCSYYILDKEKEYEKIPIGTAFDNEEVVLYIAIAIEIHGECVELIKLSLTLIPSIFAVNLEIFGL